MFEEVWEGRCGSTKGALLASTYVHIQRNAIGDEGARDLAGALEHHTCITHLNVAVCSRARWNGDGVDRKAKWCRSKHYRIR